MQEATPDSMPVAATVDSENVQVQGVPQSACFFHNSSSASFFHNPHPYQLSLPAATAWQERFLKNLRTAILRSSFGPERIQHLCFFTIPSRISCPYKLIRGHGHGGCACWSL